MWEYVSKKLSITHTSMTVCVIVARNMATSQYNKAPILSIGPYSSLCYTSCYIAHQNFTTGVGYHWLFAHVATWLMYVDSVKTRNSTRRITRASVRWQRCLCSPCYTLRKFTVSCCPAHTLSLCVCYTALDSLSKYVCKAAFHHFGLCVSLKKTEIIASFYRASAHWRAILI